MAATAVIGGGTWGITRLTKRAEPAEIPPTPVVTPEKPDAQEVFPVSLPPEASELPVLEEFIEEKTAADPLDEAMAQYRMILSNAASYDFGEYASPNGEYLYALEYMEADEHVPTLLLRQCGNDSIDHIRIFYYDSEADSVLEPEGVITAGVAASGGYRGELDRMADGHGLRITEIGGMRGDIYVSRALRTGTELTVSEEWSGYLYEEDPSRPEGQEIIWYALSDPSGFDRTEAITENTVNDAAAQEEAAAQAEDAAQAETADEPETAEQSDTADSELTAWIEGEKAAGRVVLTGNIDTFRYDKVVELQGCPDPNAAYADKDMMYRIIVLDEPQTLAGSQLGDYKEATASMIRIGLTGSTGIEFMRSAGIPAEYDGQHIVFSVSPDTVFWPTDTGLPLGQPYTSDIHLRE